MKLQITRPSENVVVVQSTVNDRVETTVIDTATGTKPVALAQYASDQGGTRPVAAERPDATRGTRLPN